MEDFSKISPEFFKKIALAIGIFLLLVLLFIVYEVYLPLNQNSHETIIYTVQKGWGSDKIANDLQRLGIIKSSSFFQFYATVSLQRLSLKAGDYNLSPRDSIYQITKKIAQGDVIKDIAVILEGWDSKDVGKYLESKGICKQDYFLALLKKDYSDEFDFLKDKPKDAGLEGYLFPDTYQISKGETCEELLDLMLGNFGKKLTPDLRNEILNQKKSIFDIVTMASIIEKEVRIMADKKIVSGILWKRISIGMPLQLDSTINYIISQSPKPIKWNTSIDSPYNTYKYPGLPKGPISNPGADSIMAAIYPKTTNYWFFLTDGKTIFSETLDQHNAAKAKYLK
jgi:UPF0755 protein